MPRKESSRYKLSHGWLRGEDWWGDPVSDNFVLIDMLLHPFIISMTETVPPLNGLTVGDMYLVPEEAEGAWLDHDGDLAVYNGTAWLFCKPTRGVRARLQNPSMWIWFNGLFWLDESQDGETPPALQGTRYDIAVAVTFEAEPEEVLLVFAVPEAMTLPSGGAGSRARALAAPNGICRLVIRRNGAEIGTILYTATSVKGEFTVNGDKAFAAGDLLSVHMPVNAPAGFQNFAATIRLLLQK